MCMCCCVSGFQPCFLDGDDTIKCCHSTMRSVQNTLICTIQGQLCGNKSNDEGGLTQGTGQLWASGSQLPIAFVSNLRHYGVHCDPVSVHLNLWNGAYLMDLAPAHCCIHVFPVIDWLIRGLTIKFTNMLQ